MLDSDCKILAEKHFTNQNKGITFQDLNFIGI